MSFLRVITGCLLSFLLLTGQGVAAESRGNFYRNYWMPTYHGHRLASCLCGGKDCGARVADRYCRIMGYASSNLHIIDNNVGLTSYLDSPLDCKGWRCNGFKTIRCVATMRHKPPRPYHYSKRRFVYPRYSQYRVDWCYDGKQGCGRRAAFSFCRRLGYMQTIGYAIQNNISATKAIGNQKLCFGPQCKAFEYILCSR